MENGMTLLKNGKYSTLFSSSVRNLEKVEALTEKIAGELSFIQEEVDDLSIAITELFNNAIHHGNKKDSQKKIAISYYTTPEYLLISVKDEGKGFNPKELKDPLAPENLLAESGRGLYLVRKLMDNVDIRVDADGCEIIIQKKLPKAKER